MPRNAAAFLSLLLLSACSSGLEIVTGCADERGIHPICGFQNPEDLVLLDDGRTLLVSQFGGAPMDGSRAGSLALFDVETESIHVAYPREADVAAGVPTPRAETGWGDAACPGPPGDGFSPHGIDLVRRADGRRQLFVVNHGGREAVVTCELLDGPEIVWRGCAVAPDVSLFNDVVGLPDGGFLVTRMMDKDSMIWDSIRAALGFDTGLVYEWQPGTGFRVVPGSEGGMPNGIEVSADGREVFVAMYGHAELRRISRDTGEVLATAQVVRPDNLTWSGNGRLLVASHVGSAIR